MNIFTMWPRGIRRRERLDRGSREAENASTSGTGHDDGFTLIEVLGVLVIIGLIIAVVGPQVINFISGAKLKTANIQIQSFESTLDLYYLDLGRYPSTSEGLAALVRRPAGTTGWNGPYLKNGSLPSDPWGHPYIYRSPSEHGPYEIVSLGSSGKDGGTGTSAAIKSWERR